MEEACALRGEYLMFSKIKADAEHEVEMAELTLKDIEFKLKKLENK